MSEFTKEFKQLYKTYDKKLKNALDNKDVF